MVLIGPSICMKKLVLPLLLIFLNTTIFSQKKSDLGVLAGCSYYMGDINPAIPFYAPKICLGINYRHNLNPRYVIKVSANYLSLYASDADFSDPVQKIRSKTFSSSVYDFTAQFEFNFLPFKFVERKVHFTPFVSSGVGMFYLLNSSYTRATNFVLPAALGVKCSLGRRISVGLEWNLRSTFNDKFDGVENPSEKQLRSIFHNSDWYYYTGLFFAYKV
jgi:hypothetical protein